MQKPQEIKLLGLHLVQAKSLQQFTYTEGDNKGKRRRGLKFYTLYQDDDVQEGPNGIFQPFILTNKTDGKALTNHIENGLIYLEAYDAER